MKLFCEINKLIKKNFIIINICCGNLGEFVIRISGIDSLVYGFGIFVINFKVMIILFVVVVLFFLFFWFFYLFFVIVVFLFFVMLVLVIDVSFFFVYGWEMKFLLMKLMFLKKWCVF